MFIVITGLDGSGTSSIAEGLHNLDENSYLFKTPSIEFRDRDSIDRLVREVSPTAHMLYYLSSTVYMSDYIKKNCDYINNNIYVVRYLIDTVVSNRVAGIPLELNYNLYGNQLLVPDLTLFVQLNEQERQFRITNRGKSDLDKVLDDDLKRAMFLKEFNAHLDKASTIYVDNNTIDLNQTVAKTYRKILEFKPKNK